MKKSFTFTNATGAQYAGSVIANKLASIYISDQERKETESGYVVILKDSGSTLLEVTGNVLTFQHGIYANNKRMIDAMCKKIR